MKYDAPTLTGLAEELSGFRTDLQGQADNLREAAQKLMTAWEGNEGYEAFAGAKKRFDAEFGEQGDLGPETTIGKLDNLSRAVSEALSNAQGTDSKVRSGFGG